MLQENEAERLAGVMSGELQKTPERGVVMSAPQLASSDADPQETREWLEALQAVIVQEGPGRAHFLLEQLIALGHQTGINMPYSANTEYANTIPADQQPVTPGAL
jgi:pyruvate dehydrogenase complex dehydrogenase (E1) component